MTHRLFLAIDLPEELDLEIITLQNRLSGLHLPVVWQPPEKLHLTLNFLGRVSDEQVGMLSRVITQITARTPPLLLTPSFLETLYQKHDSSLIYLSISQEPDRPLTELYKLTSAALTGLKMPQSERFAPHITIGKIKKSDPETTKKVLEQISTFEFSAMKPFVANRLVLYESTLNRSGSHFQKTGQFIFSTA